MSEDELIGSKSKTRISLVFTAAVFIIYIRAQSIRTVENARAIVKEESKKEEIKWRAEEGKRDVYIYIYIYANDLKIIKWRPSSPWSFLISLDSFCVLSSSFPPPRLLFSPFFLFTPSLTLGPQPLSLFTATALRCLPNRRESAARAQRNSRGMIREFFCATIPMNTAAAMHR